MRSSAKMTLLHVLTKGQRRDLQRRMHLPDEPLLESQDEWSAATKTR